MKLLTTSLFALLLSASGFAQTTVNFTNDRSSFVGPTAVHDAYGHTIAWRYYAVGMQMTTAGNTTTATNYYSIYFTVAVGSQTFTGGSVFEGHYFVPGVVIPDFTATNLQGTFDGTNLLATFDATDTQPVSGTIGEVFGKFPGPRRGEKSLAVASGGGAFTFPTVAAGAIFPKLWEGVGL